MAATAAQINPRLEGIRISGQRWTRDVAAAVETASIELSTTEASQLTLRVADPGLKLAAAGWFRRGLLVDYEDQHMIIAASELGPGTAGTGGLTITCRPRGVANAKKRKGKLVMRNVSPSQFVAREGAAAGMRVIAQPNARRKSIARDVPVAGDSGTADNSSWTTFRRLADEIGYLCFENANVLFFGSAGWLRGRIGQVSAGWLGYPESTRTLEVPTCRVSLDAMYEAHASFTVPANRAGQFRPGKLVSLGGVAGYSGTYMVTGVSFDLALESPVSVTAERGTDPTPAGRR